VTALSLPRAGRRWLFAGFVFIAILCLGAAPWPGTRMSFSHGFSSALNLLVSSTEFGNGGRAELIPKEAPGADVAIRLTVAGQHGHWDIERSLRKFAYLPLLIVSAAILAWPLGARRKLAGWLLGSSLSLTLSAASLWLTIVYSFARAVDGVYRFGPFALESLEVCMRALVLPSGVWKIGPVLLALTVVGAQHVFLEWRKTVVSRLEGVAPNVAERARARPRQGKRQRRLARRSAR